MVVKVSLGTESSAKGEEKELFRPAFLPVCEMRRHSWEKGAASISCASSTSHAPYIFHAASSWVAYGPSWIKQGISLPSSQFHASLAIPRGESC